MLWYSECHLWFWRWVTFKTVFQLDYIKFSWHAIIYYSCHQLIKNKEYWSWWKFFQIICDNIAIFSEKISGLCIHLFLPVQATAMFYLHGLTHYFCLHLPRLVRLCSGFNIQDFLEEKNISPVQGCPQRKCVLVKKRL